MGNLFWRFGFPLLLAVAAVSVFLLWRAGTKAVLDSTDGRLIELITDPALPGYEAFADPTPTMLIAHVEQDELVGLTVMARTALDKGGNIVVLSPDLLVETDSAPGQTAVLLGQAYSSGGVDRLQTLVEAMFGFGFTEVAEIDSARLGALMALVEPIPFGLADELVRRNGSDGVDVWLSRGLQELDGTVAAEVFGFRNPGEFDINRVERQLDMWRSWINEVANAADPQVATLPFKEGLSPYLRSFAAGTVDIQAVPMSAIQMEPDTLPLYVTQAEGDAWIADKILEMVPLPISTRSVHRPSVRLLDGTGDPANRLAMRQDLVADGEVISIIGNAAAFGLQSTSVAYHQAEFQESAARVAASMGAELVFDEQFDLPYDLTVTVGIDRSGS